MIRRRSETDYTVGHAAGTVNFREPEAKRQSSDVRMPSSLLASVEGLQRELQRLVAPGQGYRATSNAVRQWRERGGVERAVALWLVRCEAARSGHIELRRLTLAAWTHLDRGALLGELLLHEQELSDFRQEISELLQRGYLSVSGILAALARAQPNDLPRLIKYAATMWSGGTPYRADFDPILRVFADLLESKEPAIRLSAVQGIPNSEGPIYLEARLCGLLRDSVRKVRVAVVHLLGRRRSEQAIGALAATLASDDERIARVAAWSLGEIECEAAVEAMYRLMHIRPSLRREIVLALVRAGDLEAVPLLIRHWLVDAVSTEACGSPRHTSPLKHDQTLRTVEELAKRVLLEHEPEEVDRLVDGLEPEVASIIRKLVPKWSPGARRSKTRPRIRSKFQTAPVGDEDDVLRSLLQSKGLLKSVKVEYLGRHTLSSKQMKLLDALFLPRRLIRRKSSRRRCVPVRSCPFCGRPPEHLGWVWHPDDEDTLLSHLHGCSGWMTVCDDCQWQATIFDV